MKTTITVSNKKDLKQAKEDGYNEIIVEGKLADDLKKTKKIAIASGVTLTAITAAIGLAPSTGGLSLVAAAPIAAMTGFEVAAIIIAASLGLGLIIALFKDYEEISFEDGKLVLRKKQTA